MQNIVVVGVLLLLLAFIEWMIRPPRARASDAPAHLFSAERAYQYLQGLVDQIGHRIPGRPGYQKAQDFLIKEFKAIATMEVVSQVAVGQSMQRDLLRASRHTNIIARLPGKSSAAILVNAHYDSPVESVGAADDGAAVATMLETARALAVGPPLALSIIFLANGSEEYGRQSARSFMEQHPWARDVVGFINLEAAGNAFPFCLLQGSAQNATFFDAYEKVPRPCGNSVSQELLERGILPSFTDYERLVQLHQPGVDLAFIGDGYAYHTNLDRSDRVSLTSLQHQGDTLISMLRHLCEHLNQKVGGEVFFDILTRYFVHYPLRLRWLVAAFCTVVGVIALLKAAPLISWPWLPVALLVVTLALAVAVVIPVLVTLVCEQMSAHIPRWYAMPAYMLACWIACALVGQNLLRLGWSVVLQAQRVPPDVQMMTLWGATVVLCFLLTVLATQFCPGVAYLPAVWLVGGSAGLWLAAAHHPWLGQIIAIVPGTILTYPLARWLVIFLAPTVDRLIPSFIVGAVVGLTVGMQFVYFYPEFAGNAYVPLFCVGAFLLALITFVLVTRQSPFSVSRPERLRLTHVESDQGNYFVVIPASRHLSPQIRARLAVATSVPADLRSWFKSEAHWMATPPAGLAMPAIEVLTDQYDVQRACRTVWLRLTADGYASCCRPVNKAMTVWRVKTQEGCLSQFAGEVRHCHFNNPPQEGIEIMVQGSDCGDLTFVLSSWFVGLPLQREDLFTPFPASATLHAESVVIRTVVVPAIENRSS